MTKAIERLIERGWMVHLSANQHGCCGHISHRDWKNRPVSYRCGYATSIEDALNDCIRQMEEALTKAEQIAGCK